jgi:hypothetical protein
LSCSAEVGLLWSRRVQAALPDCEFSEFLTSSWACVIMGLNKQINSQLKLFMAG